MRNAPETLREREREEEARKKAFEGAIAGDLEREAIAREEGMRLGLHRWKGERAKRRRGRWRDRSMVKPRFRARVRVFPVG